MKKKRRKILFDSLTRRNLCEDKYWWVKKRKTELSKKPKEQIKNPIKTRPIKQVGQVWCICMGWVWIAKVTRVEWNCSYGNGKCSHWTTPQSLKHVKDSSLIIYKLARKVNNIVAYSASSRLMLLPEWLFLNDMHEWWWSKVIDKRNWKIHSKTFCNLQKIWNNLYNSWRE